MARSHKLLLAGSSALVALVGVLWWILVEEPPEPAPIATVEKPTPGPTEVTTPAHGAGPVTAVETPGNPGSQGVVEVADPLFTTVAWPVTLRLDLVRAAGLPRSADVAALGAGATARLTGSVLDGDGSPLAASVSFVSGPNVGRVLRTNASGKFGASDLYPGLSMVEIDGPGELDVRRPVRLRAGAETPLHLGFGLPGAAGGRVLDRAGNPVEGATVELDRQVQYTGADGSFLFPSVPCGLDLVCVVSKPGFASHTERVTIAARQTNDRLVFTLLPAASLDVEIAERVGAPGEALVLLMNASPAAQRSFPWERVNPLRVAPGSRVRIDGLPPGLRVRACAFHAGAESKPAFAEATLEEGVVQQVVLHLVPAPVLVGVVKTRDGLVAQGARVRLESPDRVGATLAFFEEGAMFLETESLPTLPIAFQEAVADHNGRFEFTSYPKLAPRRYLVAETADGKSSASLLVGPKDELVELILGPRDPEGELAIEFPGRFQALEVECIVQGAPRDKRLVPADESYTLSGLAAGRWRLAANWRGQDLGVGDAVGALEFDVSGSVTQSVRLPRGAIQGQDEDTLRRAGKRP